MVPARNSAVELECRSVACLFVGPTRGRMRD
ncbi:hypothetical protein FHR81_004301 [Actinoalloteichus hoggarensis]|nr:hypothetical protein [Actinoalloteichus hoggarensis]